MEANGYHKVFSGLKVRYIFLSNYKRFQVNEKCAFVCFGGVEYHSILAVYSNLFASCLPSPPPILLLLTLSSFVAPMSFA